MMLKLYSLLMFGASKVLSLLDLMSPVLQKKLGAREGYQDFLRNYRNEGPSVLFFCSSAGEFEQAKPLAALAKADGYTPIFIFFSTSALRYVQSRKEDILFFLSPFDHSFAWKKVFSILKPKVCMVVRHELWPGFLHEAKKWGSLWLVNFSAAREKAPWHERWLHSFFTGVHAVTPEAVSYGKLLGGKRILAGFDTKYDRVFERAALGQKVSDSRLKDLEAWRGPDPLLVIGSAWEDDVKIVLAALKDLKNPPRLIVAPHELSAKNIEKLISHFPVSPLRFSEIMEGGLPRQNPYLMLDTMGFLAEVYSLSNFVFVGGAMHHEVHNVLEPAIYKNAIAFGPRYFSAHEAIAMAKDGAARVISKPEELVSWLSGENAGSRAWEHVEARLGGSKALWESLFQEAKVSKSLGEVSSVKEDDLGSDKEVLTEQMLRIAAKLKEVRARRK